MLQNHPTKLGVQSKCRPPPEKEKLLDHTIDSVERDLQAIVSRTDAGPLFLLALEGLKTIRERGNFLDGHTQEEFIFMSAKIPSQNRDGFEYQVLLCARVNTSSLHEIGLDFYTPEELGGRICYRCYVRFGDEVVRQRRSEMEALSQQMKTHPTESADEKWNHFLGHTARGEYTEERVMISAISYENYEVMEAKGIRSRNPEDLAKLVIAQIGFDKPQAP